MGSQGSSQVVAWDTGFHSSPGGELRFSLELGGVFRVHLELPWGILSTSLGAFHLLQGCKGWVLSCSNVGWLLISFGVGLYKSVLITLFALSEKF